MKGRKLLYSFAALLSLGVGLTVAGDGIKPQYTRDQKFYHLTQEQASFIRPGLNLVIQKVVYNPPGVVVTFQITDDAGQGLDRLGVETPGPVSTSFLLASILPGQTQYTSYFSNTVTVAASASIPGCTTCTYTGQTATQATGDSGGTYANTGNGIYTYTFGKPLPANFNLNGTNTLGMYARRDLSAFGFPVNTVGTVANATLDFVPNGTSAVTQVRDVVATAACNQCHDPLNVHGGSRQSVKICILCHNPGTTDPYTGNTVDFKVFIHKLHMGANLPSVTGKPMSVFGTSGAPTTSTSASESTQAPEPAGWKIPAKAYQVIGFQNSVADFSSVIWPQDVRNCTTCHQGGAQSDNYKNNPNRAACGSCHDNVNFATGLNHPGGVQTDDSQCSTCHPADTGLENDLSVVGAHTILTKSKNMPGVNIKILQVTNTKPGANATVSFTVTDNAGNPLDVSKFTRLSFEIAGPTTDYSLFWPPASMEDATKATPTSTGYNFTFTNPIPQGATGTFAIGAEAERPVTWSGALQGQTFSAVDTAFNPVFYFSVDGSAVVPRATVVDMNRCNVCHSDVKLHGGMRRNTQYCILCHNANDNDGETRPASQNPVQTISFRTLLHRVHKGDALENDWSIFGHSGTPVNYNGLRFPGDLRDCAKCHVNNTNEVPVPDGLVNTPTPRLFYSPLAPTASACLGCHDGEDAAAHTYQMTAPFGESCSVCHQEGADFAVSEVHSR